MESSSWEQWLEALVGSVSEQYWRAVVVGSSCEERQWGEIVESSNGRQ